MKSPRGSRKAAIGSSVKDTTETHGMPSVGICAVGERLSESFVVLEYMMAARLAAFERLL